MKNVCVLLSAYNGSRFLEEQINSILSQKDVNVFLLVRDDCSKDNNSTIDILKHYKNNYKNIDFYSGDNLGFSNSFIDLCLHANGYDYYAFADQDDVWLECKLINAINKLSNLNDNQPNLYHSNLTVVDEKLNHIKQMKTIQTNENTNRYKCLFVNEATGCTCVFNNKAKELLCRTYLKSVKYHDDFINIICTIFGSVVYDNNSYILYRQHSNNVVGDIKNQPITLKKRINDFISLKDSSIENKATIIINNFSDLLTSGDLFYLKLLKNHNKSFISKLLLIFDKRTNLENTQLTIKNKILLLIGKI